MNRRTLLLAAPLAAPALALAWGARGQGLSHRPITITVPLVAGGPTDTVARLVAEAMSHDLAPDGVPAVVVENVGGAGGTIASAKVAQARPDGTAILIHHIGHAATATLYRRLPYDCVESFAGIGQVNEVPVIFCTREGFPADDLRGLIALIRQRGEAITMGNAGLGGSDHMAGMLLQQAAGAKVTTVSFRGSAPAQTEVLAGRIDMMPGQTTSMVPHIRAGKMKPIAVTAEKRLVGEGLDRIPTVVEQGQPDMLFRVWHGLLAPKGTPAPVLDRLSRALQAALRDPKVLARFADLLTDAPPPGMVTPAAFDQLLRADVARWRPLIQAAGQYAD